EIEALSYIWPELERTKGTWGMPAIKVPVTPLGVPKEQRLCEITCVIAYGQDYPTSVPVVRLEGGSHLTDRETKELASSLALKAQELRGQEMVHDLLMVAQEYLGVHDRERRRQSKSLWEQARHKELQVQEAREILRKEGERTLELEETLALEKEEQLRLEGEQRRKSPAMGMFAHGGAGLGAPPLALQSLHDALKEQEE
ncbi:unnamed protein product, partial [Chrysoparadoxa australica]